VADVFLCLSDHEGFCVPLQEAMHFSLPVIAYDAGAVRETLHGGGVLLQDKRPDLVAEILDRVTHGGPLRRAVLASQARAIAEIRATDFGALLADRLAPVLLRDPSPPVDPEGSDADADRGAAGRPEPS
jgi:glycosyltransferase involved in cell wall biosynthesis